MGTEPNPKANSKPQVERKGETNWKRKQSANPLPLLDSPRRRRRRWPGRGRQTPRRAWTRPTARSTPPSAAPPTPSPSSTARPCPSRSSPSRPASATPSCVLFAGGVRAGRAPPLVVKMWPPPPPPLSLSSPAPLAWFPGLGDWEFDWPRAREFDCFAVSRA
jgi:hypothetical protein